MITPNIYSLELDITYACGFGCNNCNRMTVVAPGKKDQNVTPEQVDRMLRESVECGHAWRRFSILGGEPTVHPQFKEIVALLCDYKRAHNPTVHIRLTTHGNGELTAKNLAWLSESYPQVQIINTRKKTNVQRFDAINLAPADLDPEWSATHQYEGCWIAKNCGIGFNFAGFYCCAIAGAIDRVWGLNAAIRKVAEISTDRLMATYDAMCSKCGHYRPIRDNSTTPVSSGWRKSLALYQEHGERLPRY